MANDRMRLHRLSSRTKVHSRSLLVVLTLLVVIVVTLAHAASTPPVTAPRIIAMVPLPNTMPPPTSDLSVDQVLNIVYVGGGNPAAQPVVVLNGLDFTTTQPGPVGQGVGINPVNDQWWAPTVHGDSVNVFVGNTDSQVTTIPTGSSCPIAAVYDFKFSRMWVGAQCTDAVFAYNAMTFQQEGPTIPAGGVFGALLVNSNDGIVYVCAVPPGAGCGNTVPQRVDPVTFSPSTSSLPNFPGAVDAFRNLIYGITNTATATCPQTPSSSLYIANGGSRVKPEMVEKTISLPFNAQGPMDLNNAVEHLYIGSCTSQNGTDTWGIDIRNSISGAKIFDLPLGPTVTGIKAIAADPLRGRIYVQLVTTTGPFVYVIDDVSTVAVGGAGSNGVSKGH